MIRTKGKATIPLIFVLLTCFPAVASARDTTPLHIASWDGNVRVVMLSLMAGDDANVKDKAGNTPLHIASWKGYADVVELLLVAGASVNAKDRKGLTPLHLATSYGHADVIKVLLDAGADVNAKDKKGNTSLYYASRSQSRVAVAKLLIAAGGRE